MSQQRTIWSTAVVLALISLVGAGVASAQQAVLYELVENMDVIGGHRVSHWAAQGTARGGSAFCPGVLLTQLGLPATTGCAITAFGMDDIRVDPGDPLFGTGRVEADLAVVLNLDNVLDPAEAVVMTGRIVGDLWVVPWGPFGVTPDLNARKATLGPSVPIIRLMGTFTPNAIFGHTLPAARFTATFRLPFAVTSAGRPKTPVRDGQAFYLADGGQLVRVQKNEYALGDPALRAEVNFE